MFQERIAEKDEEIASLKGLVEEGQDMIISLTDELEETRGQLAQLRANQTRALATADSMVAKHSRQPKKGSTKTTQPKKQPTGVKRPPSGVSGGPTKGAKSKRAIRG